MRKLSICLVLLWLLAPVAARSGEAPAPWPGLAGMNEELEAEKLELRDELISAQIGYLSALELAMSEIGRLSRVDPKLPLAWSRAEYLMETSFRLVGETGELEPFLAATDGLRPDFPPPPEAVDPASGMQDEADLEGGLIFSAGSARLRPEFKDGRLQLVDPATSATVLGSENVLATPRLPEVAPAEADFQLIRARAAWLRAMALERLGKTNQAAEETAGLGLIRDWLVLGPLESDSESTADYIYGLEELYETLSDSTVYPGKNGPVKWRPFTSIDSLGRVYPDAMFRSDGLKAAYFLALVHSPDNREAVLRFGSNAPATVCVNHIQERRDSFAGLPNPDQDAMAVWLRKGWNVILVRTSSGTDGWSLAVRLTCRDGTPFPGYVAMPNEANLAAILEQARQAARRTQLDRSYRPADPVALGGVAILSQWLPGHENDARANFYLASFLVAKRMMEGPARFNRELIFQRALELSDHDPFFSLMAARSIDLGIEGPDREENLRLVLLKGVADKGSAAALVDMGRLYLDTMRQPRRASEYAELALAVNPMSLRAGVLDYDIAVDMDWKPIAKELLERLVKRHPSAAAARLRLGRAALAGGRHRQALGEFHAILGMNARNREALDGAVVALGMLGQTSAAVDLLVTHIERFPYDFPARLKLAELYRVIGRDAEALAVLDAALRMAPDDQAALAMRMDIDRETYAEGRATPEPAADPRRSRRELDMTPPKRPPPDGWEYLYFQTEDRMAKSGSISRTVSFALRIYTAEAARMVRQLGFWLERDYEQGTVVGLNLILPNGQREVFTPPALSADGGSPLRFYLPPLATGMVVEASVEITRARIPFLGEYFGQIAPLTQQAPVRLSRYMFTSPKDRQLYFRPVNGAPEAMVVESPDGQEVTRIWEMSDLPAFVPEPDSPGQDQLMPCVQMSSFADWDEFARWYWRLIGGQYHTPPELRSLAEKLGAGSELPLVKLDRAAEWVAHNIGNREWSFGPYAFRPINARSIISRLSADGKDRTLFLCLLAREYGLTAWPVLARSRNRRFPPRGTEDLSLPLLDHFNHSMVLVESNLGGDIFLDASNPYRQPGVMPSQSFGENGMAITSVAAEKVTIPDNGADACRWEDAAELDIEPDGGVTWSQTVTGHGTAAELLRRRFANAENRAANWQAFLVSLGAAPLAAVEDFREEPRQPAVAKFAGRAKLRQYAAVEENRVILSVPGFPGAVHPQTGRDSYPLSLGELAWQGIREQDLVLPYGFRIARHLDISFPEEWHLVNAVQPFEREYPFGKVALAVESSPGGLVLDVTLEIPGHRIASGDFPAFREMSALADRWLKLVLVWEKP